MKILIIDDHPLFRAGIATTLLGLGNEVELIEVATCEEGLERLESGEEFALVLLDLELPGVDGMTAIPRLRKTSPITPIVVVSATEDSASIKRAIDLGVMGYIPKSSNSKVILNALKLVLNGGVYLPINLVQKTITKNKIKPINSKGETLTKRQQDVLKLLTHGNSNKLIAQKLDLSENTVRVHVAAIFKFLDVKNRTEAGFQAHALGLVSNK